VSPAITEEVRGTTMDSDGIRAIAGTVLEGGLMDLEDSKVHQAVLLSVVGDF
jgi:hypothetical protein